LASASKDLVSTLDESIDQVSEDESAPLLSMMDFLSALVETIERKCFRIGFEELAS